jgi:restriction system protein
LTVFKINENIVADIDQILSGDSPAQLEEVTDNIEEVTDNIEEVTDNIKEKETFDQIKDDTAANAHEMIKDRILALSAGKMEELVAALLRVMGYKTKVSLKGRDRGVDIFASPDGLGLETPRIKVEVKHQRNKSMGAPLIRSFLGGLRSGDRGLYISTGGFTTESKYEAERANVPTTLVNLDDLARLVVSHYESFDEEGKRLIPLVRIYWPVE